MTTATKAELDLLDGDLADRIEALGLEQNAADLALKGYTVVENAAPPEFIQRLRDRIMELFEEQRAAGATRNVGAVFEESAWMLLGRGRVFEEAECNPKFVALNEFMLGKGYRASTRGATLKVGGSTAMALHTDLVDFREPYPPQCWALTSIWALDDWTEAGGATRIVPGSFRLRRGPAPGEGDDKAIPIECPRGSIIIWDGASWHGNCARTESGERLAYHTPSKHFALRTFESYKDIPDEIVDRNPPIFTRIIGREGPYGKQTNLAPPGMEIARMRQWLATPSYPRATTPGSLLPEFGRNR